MTKKRRLCLEHKKPLDKHGMCKHKKKLPLLTRVLIHESEQRDIKAAARRLRERDIYPMTAFGVESVIKWIRDPNRKAANFAFTAGPERQIAYAVEGIPFAKIRLLDMSDQEIRLACGEMTAGEMRSVRAVLGYLKRMQL